MENEIKEAITMWWCLGLDLKCALGFSWYAIDGAEEKCMVAFQSVQKLGIYWGVDVGDWWLTIRNKG